MPDSRWTAIATKSRTRQGAQWRPTPEALISTTTTERAGTPGGTMARAAGRIVQRLFSRPSAHLPALSPPSPEAARHSPREISGASLFNYAGASDSCHAPAASWQEWQAWAARAPKGQRKERQEALREYTNAMLRREVGR